MHDSRIMKAHTRHTDPIDGEAQHVHAMYHALHAVWGYAGLVKTKTKKQVDLRVGTRTRKTRGVGNTTAGHITL
jgi:hypothetical protein